MSNSSDQNIKQLLAIIGCKPADNSDQIEAVEYDWHSPHYFNESQLANLDLFIDTVTQNSSKAFSKFYQNDFNVTTASTTLHFSDKFIDAESDTNDYYLTFGSKNEIFGMLGIPAQTAINWTTQLLDGSDPAEGTDRDLTQLEQSLLLDLGANIVKAFSDAHGTFDLQPAEEFVMDQIPLKLEKGQELCKISFDVKKTESESSSQAYFLTYCNLLLGVTGEKKVATADVPDATIKKAMLNHVLEMNITSTAQLPSTIFAFEDIMSLQVDDILLLNQPLNEPVSMLLEDKTIMHGRMARCESTKSIVITELANA
jgi:flagellar motor switch protein FliM